MRSLLVALLVAATPQTPAQKAKELSGQKAWEELYLAFSSGDATTVPSEQRAGVSGALVKGCQALLKDDAVMAYSLGERAAVFEESAPALRCLASAARKTEQRAAAEATLVKGVTLFPKDGGFPLELGKLLLEEQDSAGAQAALEKVPPRTREAAEAKKLLQQARQQTLQEDSARAEATRISQRLGNSATTRPVSARAGEEAAVVSLETRPGMTVRTPRVGFESGVNSLGMRVRANSRFVITYFNNDRDFAQRADYEGRIVEILETAHHFTQKVLGETREKPVTIVLYTSAEFRTVFGDKVANTVAGRYFNNAIHINNAAEMTSQTKATIVHEYVHAVMAEICGGGNMDTAFLPMWFNEGVAMFVEWKYLDVPGPTPEMMERMQSILAMPDVHLVKLRTMTKIAPIKMGDAEMAYDISGLAVQELMRREGAYRLMTLTRDVCRGRGQPSFDKALMTHYGMTLDDLDKEVEESVPKR
ncbi:peptidase MA family metallohydrolase [Myxococcus fulvus]|uniref:peptidase MA family metallohydrolase n=1 Tax=Myxococcus fulvus TaxID=33 RepID=UPI003B9AD0F9